MDTGMGTWEWEHGIGKTDIRPRFIKIGVDPGSLSPIDRKLVQAACRAHLETGLTIAVHTGPARPAFEELEGDSFQPYTPPFTDFLPAYKTPVLLTMRSTN